MCNSSKKEFLELTSIICNLQKPLGLSIVLIVVLDFNVAFYTSEITFVCLINRTANLVRISSLQNPTLTCIPDHSCMSRAWCSFNLKIRLCRGRSGKFVSSVDEQSSVL